MNLYAITDHYEVIELVVVSEHWTYGLKQYETRMVDPSDELQKSQWHAYFRFVRTRDVNQGHCQVYRSKRKAYRLAYERARDSAENLERQAVRLRDTGAASWRAYRETFRR